MESFLALSTKPQVLTTTTSGRLVGELPAGGVEPAGELLGVDLVAGAAERHQGDAARGGHRQSLRLALGRPAGLEAGLKAAPTPDDASV